MIKSKPIVLLPINRYRWMVFGRCFLAIFGGYLIASLSIPLITLLTPDNLALATYSALMLSFTVWLVVIIAVFSIKTLKQVSILTVTTIFVMLALITILKWWRF